MKESWQINGVLRGMAQIAAAFILITGLWYMQESRMEALDQRVSAIEQRAGTEAKTVSSCVARLEAQVERVLEDISEIKRDLRDMRDRYYYSPSQ